MRKSLISRLCFVPIIVFSLAIVSCSSTKKIKYFQDIPDSGQLKKIAASTYVAPTIQVNDIVNVTVQPLDQSSGGSLIGAANLSSGGSSSMPSGAGGGGGLLAALSGGGGGPQQTSNGILVDKDSTVIIPIIGKVKAVGLTTSALRDTVYRRSLQFFKEPTVVVSFANFKVNVIGEVFKPGQYVMPYEKVTIFDALAMAGDLTIFGMRENVLLIRENPDGTKTPYRINLKKSDVMSQPYFYLRQNDFIYVEPRKAKSDANDAAQVKYYGIAAAVASILIIIATRAK